MIVSRYKLQFLDGIRGLAALYVLVHHARWVLWEGYNQGYLKHPASYNILDTILMYLFSFFKYGHEAVILFFVLSGFVIHLRYARLIRENPEEARFDLVPYLKRRIRRIYPPLLLALLFTFLLDQTGQYLELPLYTTPSLYASLNENLHPVHNLESLAGNLGFLMNIYVPVWGTDGPLWSLAYEWWFYLLYPLFFIISRFNVWLPPVVLLLCSVLANSFQFFPLKLFNEIFGLMFTWWLGAFLADVFTRRIPLPFMRLFWFAPVSLAMMTFLLIFPGIFSANYFYTACALGYLSVFAVLFYFNYKNNLWWLNRLKFLGDISYSVYVLHLPLLTLLSGLLMYYTPQHSLPSGFFFVFLGVVLGLLAGWAGYRIAEKPFLSSVKR